MAQEYYYHPEEWSKERLLEVFIEFTDNDTPVAEVEINRFFKRNLSIENILDGEVPADVLDWLLDGVFFSGILDEVIVMEGCGRQIVEDDTLITLPKIFLRIIK